MKAVVPVVCGIRPAYLVDNASLDALEVEALVKSFPAVNWPDNPT